MTGIMNGIILTISHLFIVSINAYQMRNLMARSSAEINWSYGMPYMSHMESEPLAPLMLKLHRDIIMPNGTKGLNGICSNIYRVLHRTERSPMQDCTPYHNSRQSNFGDITEFYHTLTQSGKLNDTLEFPLSDTFPKFSFRASIMYLSSRKNDPGLLIETGSKSKHVLCVQSIACPPLETTSTPLLLTTTTTAQSELIIPLSQRNTTSNVLKSGEKSTEFWHVVLAGTKPQSWFLATVCLGSLSFILLLMLLFAGLYICRLKNMYNRRRCHGACRFGCRCPSEVVRQTAASAAVCGPLGLQTVQPYPHVLSPHGNGSLRSGSGFDNNVYGLNGGTLTSHRWSSNGHKIGSPLYLALSAAPDKSSLLAPGCNTPNCILEDTSTGEMPNNNMDGCSDAWSQRTGGRCRSKRTGNDGLHRSTSDGSTLSGLHEQHLKNSHSATTNAFVYRLPPNHHLPHMSLSDALDTNVQAAMIVSNTTIGQQQLADPLNAINYLQNGLNAYTYSDSGRGSGISPVFSYSPTLLNSGSVSNNHAANNNGMYIGHSALNGNHAGVDDETDIMDTQRYVAFNKIVPVIQTECYNEPVVSESDHTTAHVNRGSEGDLLDITPPSGFFDSTTGPDMNADDPTKQHHVTSTFDSKQNHSPISQMPQKMHLQTNYNSIRPLISRPAPANGLGRPNGEWSETSNFMSSNSNFKLNPTKPILKNSFVQHQTYAAMEQML